MRILCLIAILSILSCKPEIKEGIVGTWQLTYEQVDFGENANQEVAVPTGGRKIDFTADGKVSSDGNLCTVMQADKQPSSGVYDAKAQTMNISPCGPGLGATKYELNGIELKVIFVCNSGCHQRYKKIK